MAVIKKDGNFMGLPMNVARGNPIPLDKSEIWYSYEELVNYAKTDPVAYVGQILGYVDEEAGRATAYIILNTAGDLEEIGTSVQIPHLKGDNATITVNADTEIISLENWGKQYYKYVPASGTEGEDDFVAGHFTLQVVDATHPWKTGLEPKVTTDASGAMVLGWYESNPTEIQNINSQLDNLQSQISNVYTKTETETRITQAVTEAGHLRRKIVTSIADIDVVAPDADQYIYMVPNGLEENDDKYDEYAVIDDKLEKVGSWEVDLSDYVTTEEMEKELAKKVTARADATLIPKTELTKLATVIEGAEPNFINSVDETNFKVVDQHLSLISISVGQVADLQTLLNNKVNVEEGKGLSSNDLTDELVLKINNNNSSVQMLVQAVGNLEQLLKTSTDEDGNYISGTLEVIQNSVKDLTTITEQNKTNVALNTQAVADLRTLLNQQTNKVDTMATQVKQNKTDIGILQTQIGNLQVMLGDYVTVAQFEETIGTFEEMKNETSTLYAQVKELQDALTWGSIQ